MLTRRFLHSLFFGEGVTYGVEHFPSTQPMATSLTMWDLHAFQGLGFRFEVLGGFGLGGLGLRV